jgi:prepilin-type N-terminal cleavage/methylation domain-containing protein
MKTIRSAFTLVEILIALAILVLTMSIVFAVFGPSREKARKATCVSNLHQIGRAVAMYQADYDGSDPVQDIAMHPRQLGLPPTVSALVRPYIQDRQALRCPNYHGLVPEERMLCTYSWIPYDSDAYPSDYQFSEIVRKRGGEAPIMVDENHNRSFDMSKEPRWIQKRIIVLRLNQQVQTREVPVRSYFPTY